MSDGLNQICSDSVLDSNRDGAAYEPGCIKVLDINAMHTEHIMKRLAFLFVCSFLLVGCGATVDRHVVTMSDVDAELAADYGADLRWYDLAEARGPFDRDTVSKPDDTIGWTSLCANDCSYIEQAYSAIFEDIAHVAFLTEQLRQIDSHIDREQFERLARFGEHYVTHRRLQTLERRLAFLQPEEDFADRPELRRAAEQAIADARAQLAEARRIKPIASDVMSSILPSRTIVEPVRLRQRGSAMIAHSE